MSATDYLAWERLQADKHEFHAGEVFAMAGGSPRHHFLAGAMIGELRSGVRGMGCHVLGSGQRISAERGRWIVYADGVVVWGAVVTEAGASDVVVNPGVVVEVLSGGTEGYDRGEKWGAYERVGSLTDYLPVTQGAVRVEHYRRERDGAWRYRVLGAGDVVTLENGAVVGIDAVYEGAFELEGD